MRLKELINFMIMKKFFINNGSGLSLILCLIFFVMTDLTGDYLPKFSNIFLTAITYFIIALIPTVISIYYRNKKDNSTITVYCNNIVIYKGSRLIRFR